MAKLKQHISVTSENKEFIWIDTIANTQAVLIDKKSGDIVTKYLTEIKLPDEEKESLKIKA